MTIKLKESMTEKLARIIVENVNEAFHVKVDSDNAGTHYSIYIEDGVDTKKLKFALNNTKLDKYYIIIKHIKIKSLGL